MSTLKALRSRIKTVRSTQKITTAMKLVSAAKLRRAQENLASFKAYDRAFQKTWNDILHTAYNDDIPDWLTTREDPLQGKRKLIVVFMSDRGLCGSYNATIARAIKHGMVDDMPQFGSVRILPIGLKAIDSLRRDYGKHFAALLFPSREQKPSSHELIQTASTFLYNHLHEHIYASVEIWYMRFENVLTQSLVKEELLIARHCEIHPGFPPLFEPNRKAVLETVAPLYVTNSLRRAYIESQTAEQSARMRAMDTATTNASDVLTRLHRTYNRTRQATITRELIEIISGADSLKN